MILSGHTPPCTGAIRGTIDECDCGTKRAREAEAAIADAGFTILWVDWCEDARTPGLLGQILGVTDWERREVKISTKARPGRDQADLADVLEHELRHIQDPDWDCGNRDVLGRGGPTKGTT